MGATASVSLPALLIPSDPFSSYHSFMPRRRILHLNLGWQPARLNAPHGQFPRGLLTCVALLGGNPSPRCHHVSRQETYQPASRERHLTVGVGVACFERRPCQAPGRQPANAEGDQGAKLLCASLRQLVLWNIAVYWSGTVRAVYRVARHGILQQPLRWKLKSHRQLQSRPQSQSQLQFQRRWQLQYSPVHNAVMLANTMAFGYHDQEN